MKKLFVFKLTHPYLVVPQLQHRQIAQMANIFDDTYFVRAQEQLPKLAQLIQILNLVQSIEADVEHSGKLYKIN